LIDCASQSWRCVLCEHSDAPARWLPS
jgi:hypothetical protein